jgi:molecular chaperone GrpE
MVSPQQQPEDSADNTNTPDIANDDALQQAQAQAAEAVAGNDPAIGKLEALEAENAKLRDQWVRAVAETDNVRKRAQRDQEELSKYAVSSFARDMISVLENLKRATDSIPGEAKQANELLKTLGEGVDLTLQELLGVFEKYAIKRIYPLNEKFDHNLHQAVVQVEQNDIAPGTVIQVVQAGYTIHDRLLQPAMVAVSKQGEPPQHVDTTA